MAEFNKILFNNNCITEILGTVLLLGISIVVFAIVYLSVLTWPQAPSTPSCDIFFSLDDTNISLTHFGGKELPLDTEVTIRIGDAMPIIKKVSDNLDEESKNDDYWDFGEQFIFDAGESVLTNSVEVTVVDLESNVIICIGKRILPTI